MAVYEAEINNIVARLYDFTVAEQKIITAYLTDTSSKELIGILDPSPTIIGTNDLPSSPH